MEIGDSVHLNSGGPDMIVQDIDGDDVMVTWRNEDGLLELDWFPVPSLTPSRQNHGTG